MADEGYLQDLIDEAVDARLRNLKSLPMKKIAEWLEQNASQSGPDALMAHTVGPAELTPVPHCRMSSSGSQSLGTSTLNLVELEILQFDQGGMAAIHPTNRITAPIDGLYYVHLNLLLGNADATYAEIRIALFKAGTVGGTFANRFVDAGTAALRPANSLSTIDCSFLYRLAAGDFVEPYAETTHVSQELESEYNGSALGTFEAVWLSNYTLDPASIGTPLIGV